MCSPCSGKKDCVSVYQTMCNSDETNVCDLHCANVQTLTLIIITLLFGQWQENVMEIKS